jgi:hypothetical protein
VVTFLASFPPIQSAIKVGQDGMRLQFDVPETEMGNAVELLAMRGVVLRVTVEPLQNRQEQHSDGQAMATRTKRKSRWQTAKVAGADGDS